MTKKYSITINESPDGFFGYDSEAIAKIDGESSMAEYQKRLRKAINSWYPDVAIDFTWEEGGHSNFTEIEYETGYHTFADDLADIEDKVYNAGEFWVNKE